MKIPLDRQAGQPVYLQIRDRFSRLIRSGALRPGDRLPSVRELAKDIQVNKLTVIEAYSVLEADGLIHARQGSGYFVSRATAPIPKRESTFAPEQSVIIQEQAGTSFYDIYTASLQAHQHKHVIDFGLGYPHPPADLQRVSRRAIAEISESLFNYGFPQGQLTLRHQIAQMLVQQGLEVFADDLIVTNGSKQGLSLAIHYYVNPGDWVIVESPTYYGVLGVLENLGAKVIGIPMTAEGMNLELLEQYLRSHRPKLIYTISTLHNPTGLTTTQAHRHKLLKLAEQYECPILEDNAYEGLNFEPVPPPLKALDQHGWVTYLGTFSKTLMPGLRVGYMVVSQQHYRSILERKLLHDLHVSNVSQAIVSEYLASGHHRRHLNHLRSVHLQSRNVMLQSLEQHFPEEVSWTVPQGGLFLWVQLPDGVSVEAICQVAIAKNILVANSAAFFPGQQGYPALRLSFLHSPPEIEYGISVLGDLCKRYLTKSQRPLSLRQPLRTLNFEHT